MNFFQRIKAFVWSKHFLKHSGFIILTYVIIIGSTIYILDFTTNNGQKIKVPTFRGKKIEQIKSTLDELGLSYEILDSIYDPKKPEGTIVSQDPRPTDSTDVYVKEGRVIRFRVSKKTNLVEMPSLFDKSERFAQNVLKNRGLKYTISYKATSEADGAVLDQKYKGSTIKEGKKIPIGSTIQLIVGKNQASAPVDIPNLVGLTISEVKSRLSATPSLNLFETYMNCLNNADSMSARVKSQSPEFIDGIKIPSNSTISIQLDKNYVGEGGAN